MVLVAPRPLLRPGGRQGDSSVDPGTGGEVLALLRGDATARPRFDPALAGGLRAWLEDAAYDVVARRGEHAPPLALGPRRVLGDADVDSSDATADEVVLSRLVHALFRQQVHAGALGDPLEDALDALRAAGGGGGGGETGLHVESAP